MVMAGYQSMFLEAARQTGLLAVLYSFRMTCVGWTVDFVPLCLT